MVCGAYGNLYFVNVDMMKIIANFKVGIMLKIVD
jgi:hypothetical protein